MAKGNSSPFLTHLEIVTIGIVRTLRINRGCAYRRYVSSILSTYQCIKFGYLISKIKLNYVDFDENNYEGERTISTCTRAQNIVWQGQVLN